MAESSARMPDVETPEPVNEDQPPAPPPSRQVGKQYQEPAEQRAAAEERGDAAVAFGRGSDVERVGRGGGRPPDGRGRRVSITTGSTSMRADFRLIARLRMQNVSFSRYRPLPRSASERDISRLKEATHKLSARDRRTPGKKRLVRARSLPPKPHEELETMMQELRRYYERGRGKADWVYTERDLLVRESIALDPRVAAILRKFWVVTDEDRVGNIKKDEYLKFHGLLYKALNKKYTEERAAQVAEDDWEIDRGAHDNLNADRFRLALFEMADTWAAEVSAGEYAYVLERVFEAITYVEGERRRLKYRALADVPAGEAARVLRRHLREAARARAAPREHPAAEARPAAARRGSAADSSAGEAAPEAAPEAAAEAGRRLPAGQGGDEERRRQLAEAALRLQRRREEKRGRAPESASVPLRRFWAGGAVSGEEPSPLGPHALPGLKVATAAGGFKQQLPRARPQTAKGRPPPAAPPSPPRTLVSTPASSAAPSRPGSSSTLLGSYSPALSRPQSASSRRPGSAGPSSAPSSRPPSAGLLRPGSASSLALAPARPGSLRPSSAASAAGRQTARAQLLARPGGAGPLLERGGALAPHPAARPPGSESDGAGPMLIYSPATAPAPAEARRPPRPAPAAAVPVHGRPSAAARGTGLAPLLSTAASAPQLAAPAAEGSAPAAAAAPAAAVAYVQIARPAPTADAAAPAAAGASPAGAAPGAGGGAAAGGGAEAGPSGQSAEERAQVAALERQWRAARELPARARDAAGRLLPATARLIDSLRLSTKGPLNSLPPPDPPLTLGLRKASEAAIAARMASSAELAEWEAARKAGGGEGGPMLGELWHILLVCRWFAEGRRRRKADAGPRPEEDVRDFGLFLACAFHNARALAAADPAADPARLDPAGRVEAAGVLAATQALAKAGPALMLAARLLAAVRLYRRINAERAAAAAAAAAEAAEKAAAEKAAREAADRERREAGERAAADKAALWRALARSMTTAAAESDSESDESDDGAGRWARRGAGAARRAAAERRRQQRVSRRASVVGGGGRGGLPPTPGQETGSPLRRRASVSPGVWPGGEAATPAGGKSARRRRQVVIHEGEGGEAPSTPPSEGGLQVPGGPSLWQRRRSVSEGAEGRPALHLAVDIPLAPGSASGPPSARTARSSARSSVHSSGSEDEGERTGRRAPKTPTTAGRRNSATAKLVAMVSTVAKDITSVWEARAEDLYRALRTARTARAKPAPAVSRLQLPPGQRGGPPAAAAAGRKGGSRSPTRAAQAQEVELLRPTGGAPPPPRGGHGRDAVTLLEATATLLEQQRHAADEPDAPPPGVRTFLVGP